MRATASLPHMLPPGMKKKKITGFGHVEDMCQATERVQHAMNEKEYHYGMKLSMMLAHMHILTATDC